MMGVAERLYIDNGKDFKSRHLGGAAKRFKVDFNRETRGVIEALHIQQVTHARPYTPWSKTVERFFGTMERDCIQDLPGWCGNKPENKPEKLKRELAGGRLLSRPFPSHCPTNPPCLTFCDPSQHGLKDEGQGQLYKEFVRIVRDKKPPIFIAENVPGILFVNKGEAIKTIRRDFSRQGYRVQYKKLNAVEHGVPQTRERVFIVGVRKDVDVDFIYPGPTHGSDLEPFVTVRDVLEALQS